MIDPKKRDAVLTLRRLLVELKEHHPDIFFRHGLLGQMWAKHFLRVVHVSEQGVLLNEEISNTLRIIPNLSHVIQFELDKTFQAFQPYVHYEVVTFREW